MFSEGCLLYVFFTSPATAEEINKLVGRSSAKLVDALLLLLCDGGHGDDQDVPRDVCLSVRLFVKYRSEGGETLCFFTTVDYATCLEFECNHRLFQR